MIALDPNNTVEFFLQLDADKPPESRPTFIAKYLTAREWSRVDELTRRAQKSESTEEGINLLVEALSVGLVGLWNVKNLQGLTVTLNHGASVLADLLTIEEMWECVLGMLRSVRLSEESRKKSIAPSASASGPAAGVAAPPPPEKMVVIPVLPGVRGA